MQNEDYIPEVEMYNDEQASPIANIQPLQGNPVLSSYSLFKSVIDKLPFIQLENSGQSSSKPVNITIENPTGAQISI
jgi:hypothetical protein